MKLLKKFAWPVLVQFIVLFYLLLVAASESSDLKIPKSEQTWCDPCDIVLHIGSFQLYKVFGITTFLIVLLMASVYQVLYQKQVVMDAGFDDDERKLTIQCEHYFSDAIRTHVIPYSEVKLEREENSFDLSTGRLYKAIRVKNNGTYAGHIFLNHPNWDKDDLAFIESKFSEIQSELRASV